MSASGHNDERGSRDGVAHDLQVEATQRLMEALVQSENRMRRRVQILSEVVFEIGADGGLVFLNDAWCAVTGLTIAASLGRPLESFLSEEHRAPLRALLAGGEAGAGPRHYRLTRADGRRVWLEISARRLPEGGTVGVLRDVTEQRARDAERLRVQRLQSLGTLAGGIAHDLNNALTPIIVGLDLLRVRAAGEAALLDPMIASAQHGAAMVRQVLLFARGMETQRVVVSPLRLVDEIGKIARSSFPRNVEIETRCTRGLPRVSGDFTQLHQVLLNLCVNARDAMPNGGRLRLLAEACDVEPGVAGAPADARSGPHVVFRVVDTGTGIDSEVMERMFEPFFTTKGPDMGTGLGLSTALGIVKNHGGFIMVETAAGRGSTFSVHLPAESAEPERPASTSDAATLERAQGETVLFVDDDEAVGAIARAALVDLGYRVLLAHSGALALELMERRPVEEPVHLLITDIDMPGLNGIALVEQARQLSPGLAVVACSGRMGEEEIRRLRAQGVAQFLAKPFTQESLAAAARSALQTRKTDR